MDLSSFGLWYAFFVSRVRIQDDLRCKVHEKVFTFVCTIGDNKKHKPVSKAR